MANLQILTYYFSEIFSVLVNFFAFSKHLIGFGSVLFG